MNVYEELLKHFKEPLKKNQRVVNAVSQGPIGRPDSQLLLGEEGENAWNVTTTLKTHKQKYVIFSDPFFEFRKPSTYEPELWHELLTHHGVYRWQGSWVPLDELNLHTDEESFRTEASKMPYERKEQIRESLRQQGHNPDHYLIIDAHDYYEFLADFTLIMSERRGYAKDGHSAVPLVDAAVVYIRDSSKVGSDLKGTSGNYDELTKFFAPQIRELLEKITVTVTVEKSSPVVFKLSSDKNLDLVFSENICNESTSMYFQSIKPDNFDSFILYSFLLPRMIVHNVMHHIDNHRWDFSAIEGCTNFTLMQYDKKLRQFNLVFPPQVSTILLSRVFITQELGNAIPDSTKDLCIDLNKEQNLEEVMDIIKTLPNLKKLSLVLDQPVKDLDLSSLHLTTLKIESSSEVCLKAIPSTLESLTCQCESLEIPDLTEHQNLKRVRIDGIIHFIDYLPSLIEFIEVKNHKDQGQPRELSFKKFINLKYLALIDCRTIKSLKGLSPTLESLCLIKCNSIDRLSLKGLKNLKTLDLAHLGKELRIYSDDSLSSVRYFSAIGIYSAQSFTDEEIRMAKISPLFQNEEFKKIEDIARTLTSCYQIVMSTVNSNPNTILLSYRDLLEKTIRDEWGSNGSIQDMSPGSEPYSSEIYGLEKKWRIQREELPNPSEFLFTGGVQPHKAFERKLDESLRFMSSFTSDPQQFTDQNLESARALMIDIKVQADDLNIERGWVINPERTYKIIAQNDEALAAQKKIEASAQLTKAVVSGQAQVNEGRTDVQPVTVKPLDAITLESRLIADMSGHVIEAILIDQSMLMDESYYPSSVNTLIVRNSLAWKFDLDCRKFSQLEELILEEVKGLVVLINLPRSLKRLTINNCKDLLLIDFEGIRQLDTLILKNLNHELTIVNIEKIKRVAHLEIENSCDSKFEILNLISDLEECRELIIRNEKRIGMIQLPKRCASISFEHCSKVTTLDFKSVALLKNLKIEYCHELAAVRNLPQSLESLIMQYNYSFDTRRLKKLEDLPLLTEATLYLNGPEVRSDLDINAQLSDLTDEKLDKLIEKRKLEVESNDSNTAKGFGFIANANDSSDARDLLSSTQALEVSRLFLRGKFFAPDFSKFIALQSLKLVGMCLRDGDKLPKQLKTLVLSDFSLSSAGINLSGLPALTGIELERNLSNVTINTLPSPLLKTIIVKIIDPSEIIKINLESELVISRRLILNQYVYFDFDMPSSTVFTVESKNSVIRISGLPNVIKELDVNCSISDDKLYIIDFNNVKTVGLLKIGAHTLKKIVFLNVSENIVIERLMIRESPSGSEKYPLTDEFKKLINLSQIRILNISNLSYVSGLAFSSKTESIHISRCSDMDEMDFGGYPNLCTLEITASDLTKILSLPPSLKHLNLRENTALERPSLKRCKNLQSITLIENELTIKSGDRSIWDEIFKNSRDLEISSQRLLGDWKMPQIALNSQLKVLEINQMMLCDLEKIPAQITDLRLLGCYCRMNTLDFSRFKCLETIELSDLINIQFFSGLPTNLKILKLSMCNEFSSFDLRGVQKIGNLFIQYADDQKTTLLFRRNLSVNILSVNASAYQHESVANLIRSLDIKEIHLNVMGDEALLFSGVEDKVTTINIACNMAVSGEKSFKAFTQLRVLSIVRSDFITAITDLPKSIKGIQLVRNKNIQMPILDDYLNTLHDVNINQCGLIDEKYAQQLSKLYTVPDRDVRPSLVGSVSSINYGPADREPGEITLASLRNNRAEKTYREKEEKRWKDFQSYVDTVLKENNEYDKDHSKNNNMMKIEGSTVFSPDAKTGFVTRLHGKSAAGEENNYLMVYDRRGLLIDNYFRFCPYNTIVCDISRRSLFFCYQPKDARRVALDKYQNCFSLKDNTPHDLKAYVNDHPNWAMAYAEFDIKPAQEITLVTTPILYPPDQLVIFCNDAKDLDLILDPVERKVSVALKLSKSTKQIKIAYRFDIQENYLLENFNDDLKLCLLPQPLLKDDLTTVLRDVIEGVNELRVLNRLDVGLRDKLACIFEFCRNFNQEESPGNESPLTLDIILSQIENSRGVCRHRSEVFMLLAHYLNIPASLFSSGKHMWVEFLFYTKSGFMRYGVCSGGGVALDLVKKGEKIASEAVNPFIKLLSERESVVEQVSNVAQPAASVVPNDKGELDDNEESSKTDNSKLASHEAERKARLESETRAREEARLKAEVAEKERLEAERIVREEAEARAREEEARLKAEAVEKERQEAERKAREEAEARAREEEARLAAEVAEKERLEAERIVREEAEARAREEEARLAAEVAEKERQEIERKAREAAEAEFRRIAEEKARELADPFPAVKILTSIVPLLSKEAAHAPLLRLPNNLDPIKVFAGIRSEILNCQNLNWPSAVLYVHNPSDLRRYVKSVKIADGNRGFVEGPLRELLRNGGIVVINWTDFTKRQKKSYMSMLEPKGNLMGHPVSASLKIISLIQDKFRTGPRAFFSRTTPFLLSQSYKPQLISVESNMASQDTIEVDLYEMPNWRERLFGEIVVDENGYQVRENGALVKAKNEKKNLRLVNCPDTQNFNTFLNRLQAERRIYINAQFLELPDSCVIQTVKKEHALKNDNITVKSRPDDQSPLGVFCNANNLFECFHREVVDIEKRMRTETLPWFAKENQFYITERITREEWTELLDRYQDFPQRPLTFTLLPGGEIEGVAIYNGEQNALTETSKLVFSNDPDLTVNQLKAELLPKAIIVDVNPQMNYQELMAKLNDRRDEHGKIEFEYEPFVVMNDLIKGKTIILDGAMSLLLYQQLLPFLYPDFARFNQNGKSVELKGQLICVMPFEYQEQYPYQQIQVQQYHFKDYAELLPPQDHELANKIKFLFDCASQLSHRGLGQPPVPALTYRRLTSMITRLNDESLQSVHPENPIKGLFHYDYPKNSDNFAFLSVIAKILFAPEKSDKQVHSQKWARLRKAKKIETKEDLVNHVWKALNCCYGQTLRELIGYSLEKNIEFKNGKAQLKVSGLIEKLFNLLESDVTKENVESLGNEHKPTQQLKTLFDNPNTRAIFLKSTPGTGKSYQTRELRSQLREGHYFKGLIQLEACLSAQPVNDKPIVNNPDEVNMEEPGTLDVFKGFFRGPKEPVHYRGKYYKSTPQLKIVGSGNPETYANRFFHAFIQEYAETILFEMPHEEWLRKNIIDPELLELNLTQEQTNHVAEKLLWAFDHIKDYEPHCEISLRDLRSLVQRFIVAVKSTGNLNDAVKRAQWHEFGLMIRDLPHRKAYQEAIGWKSQDGQSQVTKVGNLFIPSTKYPLVEIIEEDLAVCALAADKNRAYRRGILLEGPSGIGKSSLYKAILELEQQGYSKDHLDPLKRYYEISLDEGDEAARLVIRALCDGSKIILDEIDTRIEKLLIALMEGELPEDPDLVALIHEVVGEQFEVNPSGFVMASQNPGEVISLALMNRFHYIQASDYTNEEWMAILNEAKSQRPEFVLEKFNEACKRDPANYNPRKMFEWMRKEIDQKSKESQVSVSQQSQVKGLTSYL